ncbi:response regulator transcription factor [Spirochaeta africana]|uniref:Response regulator with CheY-like receiver domain and winged-helix DNA-binding domain n=1 Tax=Spirochaeta africana (strain ATCC 700263 / DSM 8902 / Z-7692) TaxID=889378 RepID=H9UKR1_SPIAZ|nr:response regulator [Spirochaeta africana]AFG38104.1 response regulator with CheY-like receiver domain and winged-helix DNA-binding domain [Spirochaeta africana DSM 8902]
MANILVIEDNRSLYTLLQELLESRGHTVTVADNGSDGMACARETAFDLIITDIVMPHKSGIEIISELRRRHKVTAAILAISGGNQQYVQAHLETARISGADTVLPKPFSNTQLLGAVQKLLQPKADASTARGPRG